MSGALTTTVHNLTEADQEKQRLGGTYCYVNQNMRAHLVKTVQYTARLLMKLLLMIGFYQLHLPGML